MVDVLHWMDSQIGRRYAVERNPGNGRQTAIRVAGVGKARTRMKRRYSLGALLAIVALAGCTKATPSQVAGGGAEQKSASARSAADDHVLNIHTDAASGAMMRPLRAYRYELQGLPLAAGTMRIAVDVNWHVLPGQSAGIDLKDIEAIDGTTGTSFGHATRMQRLTDDGQPADEHDPVFIGSPQYRYLLIFEVPSGSTSVRLRHDMDVLTARPSPIENGGPLAELPTLEPLAVFDVGKVEARDRQRLVVLVQCRHWPRGAVPEGCTLIGIRAGRQISVSLAAWDEVTDTRQLFRDEQERPYYVDRRWFAIEFWCPTDASMLDLVWHGTPYKVPTPVHEYMPQATLESLAAKARKAADD